MTELNIKTVVVGSEEEEEMKFAEECYAKARLKRAMVFKFTKEYGPLHLHFNQSQDQIELDIYMLSAFARANIGKGDEISKEWEKAGWQKLGPRVSWRMTSHAIEFSLASGHRYQLRRTALRDWFDHKGFPRLEEV